MPLLLRPRRKSAETYWILGRAQIACLASAPRQEILNVWRVANDTRWPNWRYGNSFRPLRDR